MSLQSQLPTHFPKVLDNWSSLDYKNKFNSLRSPVQIPLWVGPHNQRRLRAYAMYEAYYSTASRWWLEVDENTGTRREYGDPFVLVETALTSLIGDTQKIIVEGSLSTESDSDPAKVHQALMDQWADDEKFYLKVIESERQSVKLADSVYVLGWDDQKKRPRIHVYDPGFYFPVFDEMSNMGSEDFPNKVHIAYEFEQLNSKGDPEIFLRRITWELVTMESGKYTPNYASESTNINCLYSDEVRRLDEMAKDVNTFSGPVHLVVTPPTYLNIDFIPVVHIPNTVALQTHFGRSVLQPVIQILDDIQATDTDLQASSSTTGSPPIVVAGKGSGQTQVTTYGPGTVFYVGDGDASMIDTSSSLDALLKLLDQLLKRLSVNSRTPESLLGRVKPNEVPSGIALTLSFAPHTSMVREMRLVRTQKYNLLLKFVSRYFGIKDERKVSLHFGSFLPAEKQEAMTMVVQLLGAKAISLETAIQMLMEAGIPIESWMDEIKRIQSMDISTAIQLMGITGDPNTALEYLGMTKIPEGDLLVEDPNAVPAKPGA